MSLDGLPGLSGLPGGTPESAIIPLESIRGLDLELPPVLSEYELLSVLDDVLEHLHINPLPPPPPLKQRKIGKYLYIPVEIAARELATRAWLAGEMCRRGFQVLLGASWNMAAQKFGDLPPGLVLFKTMNALDARSIYQAAQHGHITACMNEEILAMPEDDALYRLNCNEHSLTLIDHVLAHSDGAAKILKRLAGKDGARKVLTTGTPRRIEKLPLRPDGDIIVCGEGGIINNSIGVRAYIGTLLAVLGRTDKEVVAGIRAQIIHERRHYELVLECAHELTKIYGPRVIFRPHPSETLERYKDEGLRTENAASFSDALKTAACVVFVSGSGAGLESVSAGVPSLRLGAGGVGKSVDYGMVVRTAQECVAGVEKLLAASRDEKPLIVGDPSEGFAQLTICETLTSIWRQNQFDMPFDVVTAWKQRADEFRPESMHVDKFPPVADAEIERLTGCRAQLLDWRIWALSNGP